MWNVRPIELRKQSVLIRELTIGEAMQIAKIPQSMTEARLTSFIGFVCDDDAIAHKMTAQERYYVFLHYLSLAQNDYVFNVDDDTLFLTTNPKDVPDTAVIDGITVSHLTGRQVMVLEGKCENAYEWLAGQMACQLTGDIGTLLGVDGMMWVDMPDDEQSIGEMVDERFEQIQNLPQSQFEKLAQVYFVGCDELAHCVRLGVDNDGLTLLSDGGDAMQAVRFRPDVCFTDITEHLSQYLAQ
ncbi:MAG: hypothetical protein Q4B81_00070 [Moraxella sp.]|nr:hypothetical protein [Moraxella sp.]